MFGGFLSLMRVLSNYLLKELQTFNLEKSMIKRLFTIAAVPDETDPENEGMDIA